MSDIRFNQWLHQSGTGGVSQVASGAVGVGTTNPLADFYVRGDAQITGILTAGHIAMGSSITFGDDDRAYFGDGTDMQLYHNGTNSYIENGTNALNIKSYQTFLQNANGSEDYLKATDGYGVELYHNNNKRIETTGYGVTVFGELDTTNLSISGITTVGKVNQTLYSPHATNWATRSALTLFGNYGGGLAFNDNNNNGWVQHVSGSGVDFWLKNGAVGGALATSLKATKGGSVELYENNTKVFETTVGGISVTGTTDTDNFVNAGVSTFTGVSNHNSPLNMLAGNNIILLNDANSANCQIDCYGGAGFRLTSYNQTMFTCENGNTTKFYTDSGTSRLEITNAGDVQVVTGTLHIPDALQHYGDTDTKIRFPSNDQISFETGGSERGRFDDDGNFLIGTDGHGNAGAGARKLILSGPSNVGLSIHSTTTSGIYRDCSIYFGYGTSVGDRARGQFYYSGNGDFFHMSLDGSSYTLGKSFRLSTSTARFDSTPTTTNAMSLIIKSHKARAVNDNNGIVFLDANDHTQAVINVQKQSTSDATSDLVFRTSSGQVVNTLQGIPERMRLTSEGYLTKPYHPAFKIAIMSQASPNSGVVSENNGFTLKDGSSGDTFRDAFNTGDHFDQATGKFTAPVTGVYYFHFSVMRSSTSGSGSMDLRIKKNTALMLARSYRANYSTEGSFASMNVTTITSMTAGHYIEFILGATMSVYEDDSYMLGYLIG